MSGAVKTVPRRRPNVLRLANDTEIELRPGGRGDFAGLGTVAVQGVTLRSGRVPLRPCLKSVRGVVYPGFRLERIERLRDGGLAVHTRALGVSLLEGEHADEYDGRLLWPSEKGSRPVEDRLVWLLRPERAVIRGLTYTGFSYAWRFVSATETVFRIVAQTTWELGGRAEGNTLLSQGQVTPPIYTAARGTHFTSACLKNLDTFGQPRGMSYQLTPRYGSHPCFDFQAGSHGSLVGYWPDRADVRSFAQKNPGEDVIFVMDATHFPETSAIEIPRKCILFAPAGAPGMPEDEMRNRWKDAYDFCTGTVRRLFRIRPSSPRPESFVGSCGSRLDNGQVRMRVGQEWVPAGEWIVAMADTYLPDLAERGIKRVITQPVCRTDVTERGLLTKFHQGLHGDLFVGSACNVHRYEPADFWGGIKAWRYFYEKARKSGLEVGHWVGAHLADNAAILAEHPEWRLKGINTKNAAGGYSGFIIGSLNWNSGVRQWILDDLNRWREEGGLDYIWFDSLPNLGMVPVDYAHGMATNAIALGRFIAGVQKIGIRHVAIEGVSPFGISACGIFDPGPESLRTPGSVVGQNSWLWYAGNEDMLCDQAPRIEWNSRRTEEEARQTFFRCLANCCVPMLGSYSRVGGPRPAWFREYLDAYWGVESDLIRRRLLPERQGVLWTNGTRQVLFSYVSLEFPVRRSAKVARIRGVQADPVSHGGAIPAAPWTIYRIT